MRDADPQGTRQSCSSPPGRSSASVCRRLWRDGWRPPSGSPERLPSSHDLSVERDRNLRACRRPGRCTAGGPPASPGIRSAPARRTALRAYTKQYNRVVSKIDKNGGQQRRLEDEKALTGGGYIALPTHPAEPIAVIEMAGGAPGAPPSTPVPATDGELSVPPAPSGTPSSNPR